MDSSTRSSSSSTNKDMESHQSDNITVYIQSGGSLQTINGVKKYMPSDFPEDILHLPSPPLTYLALVKQRVKQKLNLSGSFRLFYKNPHNGGMVKLDADHDMWVFEEAGFHKLTLFVVADDNGYPPVIPIKDRGKAHADMIGDVDNEETYMTRCRRGYFYLVPQIKKLRQDKEKHTAAIMLLESLCKEVAELKPYKQILKHYGQGFKLAVENDISEVIEVFIRCFPQSTWISIKDNNLSQYAIMNRSEKVYKILVENVVNNHILRTCKDAEKNNLLHLVGKVAPKHKLNVVSGAALQMQRELQWFKEVEKFVFPSDKEEKNNDGDIPMMVFTESHDELRKAGEVWMKDTANSYTITAALIITIAFAAAITVPGGNSGDTGKAIFERRASFTVFVVSDTISLFTSSTSLLLFLSVLTARYRDEDFLRDLPSKLIVGLVMLFLSMTSMIVAFSATLYLLFGQQNTWILIPIGVLTGLPIASFITLQFPLLKELILSTYGRGRFPKHPKIKE